VTADPRPDGLSPEPPIRDGAAPEAAKEASAGAVPADHPISEPLTPETSGLEPAVVPVMPVSDAPPAASTVVGRRRRLGLGMWRLGRVLMSVGLLIVGIVLGATIFNAVQPKDPAIVAGVPSTVPPPAAVQEFITALNADNSDAVRAAVPPDPYRLLAGELDARSYQEITSVDTLGTLIDGDKSATAIIIHGTATSGQELTINLVVHAENGVIVTFR
jgi:hypothetical protein